MAEFLLNKLMNEDINLKQFISWLLKEDLKVDNPELEEIFASRVGRIDFVTYFLNFIHEEVPCKDTVCRTPRKLSTPTICDTRARDNLKRPNLFQIQPKSNQSQSNDQLNKSNDSLYSNNSTPKKVDKSLNTSQIKENSFMSPVSPLYRNQNNFTPKDQKTQNTSRKSSEKQNPCLGDFIINAKNSSKKKKPIKAFIENSAEVKKISSRRINPTNLNQRDINDAFQKTENSFNFKENSEKQIILNTIEDGTRSILLEERLKILSKKEDLCSVVPIKVGSVFKNEIEPKLVKVSFKKQLDLVIEIYVTILNHRMVLNVTSEIYFLICLLLSKQDDTEKLSDKIENGKIREELSLGVDFLEFNKRNVDIFKETTIAERKHLYNSEIFNSVHNIVYFASKCLETQVDIIKCLDKATLRLLGENIRLKEMSSDFWKQLLNLAFKKSDRISEVTNIELQTNVCFNADTDNIQNFPDQLQFHAFRKQRDLFYEILRIWEMNHISPGWQFSACLGGKIRTLFSLCQEPSNFVHMSRLFKDQLLNNCVKNNNKEAGLVENMSKLPSSLGNINTQKLNLLTNRLVTKPTSNGINSLPSFSGYQEFYKYFILVASNYLFNKHLCDCLVANILELNNSKIINCDLEEQDAQVDLNTRKLYITCIKNLRILAKFLGFIESIPYKSESLPNAKDLMQTHLDIRSKICPQLDIKMFLLKALEKNTLVLIIPWLTKYLAMLDYMTLRLPYYQDVHRILFKIYHSNGGQKMVSYNGLMIEFSLGWLFELPHFPENEYFNFCSEFNQNNTEYSPKNGYKVRTRQKCLDSLDVIDQNVLYLCCPYLEEIKKMLSANINCSNKITVRHITPVTAVETNNDIFKRKIEQQLEDAFFNGQPTSLRKTVEFVSERVASSAVKFFCHTLVPKGKEQAMVELKKMLQETQEEIQIGCVDQVKTVLKRKSGLLAQTQLNYLISFCNQEMLRISKEKIPPAIDSLVPLDSLHQTREFCVNVTAKMYAERVKQWVAGHVSLTLFSKDFDQEVQKTLLGRRLEKEKLPFVLPSGGRESTHNEDCFSGFHILRKIKDLICDIIQNTQNISDDDIISILDETSRSITERNDINDSLLSNICSVTFDLCVVLVAHRPLILNQLNIEKLTKIWRHHPKLENLFKNILSPRNIRIIQVSKNKEESWSTLARILVQLVEAKFLEIEDFESQCTGFYKVERQPDILKQFSMFLRKLSKYLNKNDECEDRFGFILDFLSDFCSDL